MVLDGEGHSFTNYLARFLYTARILTVMDRSRWDLGYSRLLHDEDLQFFPLFIDDISLIACCCS
jgi:hypothetical protein